MEHLRRSSGSRSKSCKLFRFASERRHRLVMRRAQLAVHTCACPPVVSISVLSCHWMPPSCPPWASTTFHLLHRMLTRAEWATSLPEIKKRKPRLRSIICERCRVIYEVARPSWTTSTGTHHREEGEEN